MKIHGLLLMALLCPAASAQNTGFTPLNDLGTGTYQGFEGGLYPAGANQPPTAHAAAALALSHQIVPRDRAGAIDTRSGLIGMLSIGMSNPTHEFAVFERQEDARGSHNPQIVLVNGAVGGMNATIIRDPAAPYWNIVRQRVAAAGMTLSQVQVVWLKEAHSGPLNNFPVHAQALRDDLEAIVNNLHDVFPNLRICYVSSRTFGGYATIGLNPEPQAYESGFSFKWLIEDQIDGVPELNYDPARGPVEAPLLLWGAYLWADGTNPRSDGLVWLLSDFEGDGTHPAPSGEQKVADLLSAFFPAEASAQSWWWPRPGHSLVTFDATDDAYVDAASPATNYGADPTLLAQGGASAKDTFLMFDSSSASGALLHGKLGLRVLTSATAGPTGLFQVPSTAWDESTITRANAPAFGAAIVNLPQATGDGTISCDVTADVAADADGVIAAALRSLAPQASILHSEEAGQPPRLALSLRAPADIAAGRGLGQPSANEVRVFQGDGSATGIAFFAYAAGQWGVNVATGDVNTGLDEIVTAPGPGEVFGPQVRAFDRDGTALGKVNFYAYGTLRYGANVATAAADSDRYREIVTGAGPGAVFGPHVRGFDVDGGSVSVIAKLNFFAYSTLKYGVNVNASSVDADAWDELLTGAGPSPVFAPTVRGFDVDAGSPTAIAKINFNAFASGQYGVNVGAGDVDADGFGEIAAAPGPGATLPARFLGFGYDAVAIAALAGFDATPFATSFGGRVGFGDVDGNGDADLLAGAGPDPAADATVRPHAYTGAALAALPSFAAFNAATHGVSTAGGYLGY